jgi:hypothetical protein
MRSMRFLVAMVAAFGMTALVAAPASAQAQQEGLVNVNVNDVYVAVPLSVAANICDVNVNILAQQIRRGDTACYAEAESGTTFGPGQGNGNGTQQEGLVNVNISDVYILVPISVAANICDVNVNVLADQIRRGDTDCEALAQSTA